MSLFSVNRVGVSTSNGVDKQLFSLKNDSSSNAEKLYPKINKILEDSFNNLSKTAQKSIRSNLDKHRVKQIDIDQTHLSFVLTNGKTIKVAIPNPEDDSQRISDLFNNSVQTLTLSPHNINKVVDQVVKSSGFEKVFYFYSSGGGGHVSAKNAMKDKELLNLQQNVKEALIELHGKEKGEEIFKFNYPNYQAFADYAKSRNLFEEKDVLHDFLGKVGKMATNVWDEAQKNGDVEKQESLAGKQGLSAFFFSPSIFFGTLFNLIRAKPEKIVSTQAMCNHAVIAAMVVYNMFFKPKNREDLKLHLYMTDMPTDLADHFFNTIKSMSRGQKENLILYAPKPNTGFDWNMKIGLKDGEVVELSNLELPIRPAFLQAIDKFKKGNFDPTKVQIKVSGEEERKLLEAVLGSKASALKGASAKGAHNIDFQMKAEDEAHFIMLGSQPTKSALYEYIDKYIDRALRKTDQPVHLFLFTGKYEASGSQKCLYQEISEYLVEKAKNGEIPKNLNIVPLTFQDPEQMVGLFSRAHTITRSGGATCMELMVLDEVATLIKEKNPSYEKPERLVHAQVVKGRTAENSIPLWERGNYHFMRDGFNAKIVTPGTLDKALQKKSLSNYQVHAKKEFSKHKSIIQKKIPVFSA